MFAGRVDVETYVITHTHTRPHQNNNRMSHSLCTIRDEQNILTRSLLCTGVAPPLDFGLNEAKSPIFLDKESSAASELNRIASTPSHAVEFAFVSFLNEAPEMRFCFFYYSFLDEAHGALLTIRTQCSKYSKHLYMNARYRAAANNLKGTVQTS